MLAEQNNPGSPAGALMPEVPDVNPFGVPFPWGPIPASFLRSWLTFVDFCDHLPPRAVKGVLHPKR